MKVGWEQGWVQVENTMYKIGLQKRDQAGIFKQYRQLEKECV